MKYNNITYMNNKGYIFKFNYDHKNDEFLCKIGLTDTYLIDFKTSSKEMYDFKVYREIMQKIPKVKDNNELYKKFKSLLKNYKSKDKKKK